MYAGIEDYMPRISHAMPCMALPLQPQETTKLKALVYGTRSLHGDKMQSKLAPKKKLLRWTLNGMGICLNFQE
jgi:hypothetical protein